MLEIESLAQSKKATLIIILASVAVMILGVFGMFGLSFEGYNLLLQEEIQLKVRKRFHLESFLFMCVGHGTNLTSESLVAGSYRQA